MAVHLRAGSRIRGYTLTSGTGASDAGTSMWAFAEKEGVEYFIKCYLSPTYPADDAPGSPKAKEIKRARCRAFEHRTKAVEAVLLKCGDESFLVRSVDFFREQGAYFKVTRKIDAERVAVAQLPPNQQLLVMLTAAYGIRTLHTRAPLIHADIKPENILLRRAGHRYLASLIDFDAGFFTHAPPLRESLVGDQRYCSPELIDYLDNGNERLLTQKADVFSLGLVFGEYLCGRLPEFPERYSYPGEALLDGAAIRLPPPRRDTLTPALPIIEKMLDKDPEKRPDMADVHETLRKLNKKLFVRRKSFSRLRSAIKAGWERQRILAGLATSDTRVRDDQSKQNGKQKVKLRGLKVKSDDPAPLSRPLSRKGREG